MAGKTKVEINPKYSILGNFNAQSLLLLNVQYQKPYKDTPDVCTVVYKDTSTGEKKVMEIENPLLQMYVVKEEFRNPSYYPEFKYKKECDIWSFPYNKVLSQIYKVAQPSLKAYVDHCRETGNYYSMKKLHHCPYVLGTDFPYENYFRIQWMLHYADPNVNMAITKQYLDIEVDSIDVPGLPKDGNCPINAVTVIDESLMVSFTFLLRNPNNPQIEAFEKDIDKFIECCHESFDEYYGRLEYKIYMYDEEIELIKDVFKLINHLKRDFLLVWNLSFDMPYFIDRINVLGFNPIDIMCSKDFKYPFCWFKPDRRNFDFKTKKDIFRIASYTTFMDQMINYAKVRKGQAELPSLKLNSIAKSELGDTKLDYSDEANIKTLAYVNYWKFVLYNIKDVLLQLGIERKTKDLEAIFQRAYDNATDYDAVFSQTIFLKNRVFLDYYRNLDIIKGNNINISYNSADEDAKKQQMEEENEGDYELDENGEPDLSKPKVKGFEGALVGNPLLNSHEGQIIYGKPSMFVFNFVIDFDLTIIGPHISNGMVQIPLIAGKSLIRDNQQPSSLFREGSTTSFYSVGLSGSKRGTSIVIPMDEDIVFSIWRHIAVRKRTA